MAKILESGKKINESNILEFEDKIDLKLPLEYKSFLLKYNGGECEPCEFVFTENGVESDSSVRSFFAIGGIDGDYDLEENVDIYINEEKRLLNGLIPIAEDDGGNLICICCLGLETGKIYFWDHENEDENDLNGNVFLVSNSLNEFIDNLTELE